MTAKKYLRVAFIDGVATTLRNGSAGSGLASSSCLPLPCSHSIAAMPASSRMMLTIDHMAASLVMVLPTSGSCGQLLVYDTSVSPGRSVAAAHDVQKKNAASASRSAWSGSAPVAIAYWSRSVASDGSVPNSASKCCATPWIARARSFDTVMLSRAASYVLRRISSFTVTSTAACCAAVSDAAEPNCCCVWMACRAVASRCSQSADQSGAT